MSGEARDIRGVQGRVARAREALAAASTDEAIAAAFVDECEATIDRIALSQGAQREPMSVMAARVLRGQLSPARLLDAFVSLEYGSSQSLSAVVDVLDDDALMGLFGPPFVTTPVATAAQGMSVVVDELHRRGRSGAVFERAFAIPAVWLRPIELSWAGVCAASTLAQRELARRALDARLATVDFDAPIAVVADQQQRYQSLRLLCDRALLEEPSARGAVHQRLRALLEDNAAVVRLYAGEGSLRALFALSLAESGEAREARALLVAGNAGLPTLARPGGQHFAAALRAVQRASSPEQLAEFEAQLVDGLEREQGITATVWLELGGVLHSAARARAQQRAIELKAARAWREGYWVDEIDPALCAAEVDRAQARFHAVLEGYARHGQSIDAVVDVLRDLPARGPWVEASARALGAALVRGVKHPPYSVRFALHWLFVAAKRGSVEARRALIAIAQTSELPWWDEPLWYRSLDEATVDAMLETKRAERPFGPRVAWLQLLLAHRKEDARALTAALEPALSRLRDDGYLLMLVAPYLAPSREHEIVCAALDGHSRAMDARWAEALLELALRCSSLALARKCLCRYLSNTRSSAFVRERVAQATARLGEDPRVRAALRAAFGKKSVPNELLPRSERLSWLRALGAASIGPEHWAEVDVARCGLDDDEGRAAVGVAVSALIRSGVAPPIVKRITGLLPWASPSDLEHLLRSFSREASWIVVWTELVAQVSERAPSLLVEAILAFESVTYARRAMPEVRWTKALVDCARGDRGAIERTFNRVRFAEFNAAYFRVLSAMRSMDALVDAVVRDGNNSVMSTLSIWGLPMLDDAQRARLRPLFTALLSVQRSRFDIERLAPVVDRVSLARAWSKRVVQTQTELAGPAMVRAMSGAEGYERVCSAIERGLREAAG